MNAVPVPNRFTSLPGILSGLAALLASACCEPGLCSDPSLAGADAGTTIDDGGGTGGVQPTLSDIQAKIFTPSCATAGCHNVADMNQGNLDLSSAAASFAGLVNQLSFYPGITEERVVPGSPQTSFLIVKLVAMWGPSPPPDGSPMPFGASQLSAGQEQAIQDWIAAGAPNN
jgi:hypothetical protein